MAERPGYPAGRPPAYDEHCPDCNRPGHYAEDPHCFVRLIRQSLDRHYQGELARVEDFNHRLIASIQNSSTVSGASTAEAGGTRSSRERSRSPLNQPRHGGSFRERSRSPPSQSTRLEHLTGLYGSRGSLYGY
ncbi:hypothetical protein PEBR_16037 [Penicillium brasilianum]|uniref:Uncharacterized protein n=1 Tax=Penicillium brasilianum TaxID=104259 RepID=A0A1S9RRM5_PENBI|nr:hypothetical protein PEBR_16037 [Penicillium brasilianum]